MVEWNMCGAVEQLERVRTLRRHHRISHPLSPSTSCDNFD